MFQSEGKFKVKIIDVVAAEPKFAQPPAFDICINVQSVDDPAQSDWWRGEMSSNYGKGNFANRTQTEITMEMLHKIGFEGSDLSTLQSQLVGKETYATTKASDYEGKTYYNVKYLGDSGGVVALDVSEMLRRMAELSGGAVAEAKSSKTEIATDNNPFG